MIGGADSSLYEGKIKYHKVVDQYYWTIIADKILVGGEDLGICNKMQSCRGYRNFFDHGAL